MGPREQYFLISFQPGRGVRIDLVKLGFSFFNYVPKFPSSMFVFVIFVPAGMFSFDISVEIFI